ncbi:unnamed protein product [Cylindrotheca closterium]|uniref:Uncharacterized protein n=1 Tax=Cylindrotheca closterium TaxID=2856 RepID=A0AAD2FUI9_9STRA|nr:unnamed protein product [Cylindrotheca closterium]
MSILFHALLGTTNVKLQADWHYASENEDLPDLATEEDQDMQFIQSPRREKNPFGLYNHVIMDSGCTNTTICNGELMHGLRHAEKELDMQSNVGSRFLDKEGFLGRFPPPVYHDEDGIANVLAMREMIAAGYRITMDTDADNAFIVHRDGNRKMQFVNRMDVQNGDAGLEMTSKMATVRKNKEGFTPRQVKAAMEARNAMHILNAPSTKSLKYAIRSGLIKNCPITEEAINHAEAILGPDTSTLKGKSTRPTPKKTCDDFFSPPEELYQHNRSITVCIDHMEIENAKFLTCIDTTVHYRSCIPVQIWITPKEKSSWQVQTMMSMICQNSLSDTVEMMTMNQMRTIRVMKAMKRKNLENVDRGTDDIGNLVTDLKDLQEPPEEEIVFEPEEPQVAKVTRSGQTYAQAAMSG